MGVEVLRSANLAPAPPEAGDVMKAVAVPVAAAAPWRTMPPGLLSAKERRKVH